MLNLKIKNLINLFVAIFCVVNGVTLCQAMKKTSLNGKVNLNDRLEKKPIEINSVIDGIPIPKGTQLISYDDFLKFFKNDIGHEVKKCTFSDYLNNILYIKWDMPQILKSNAVTSKSSGLVVDDLNYVCEQLNNSSMLILKLDVKKTGKYLLEKWLIKILEILKFQKGKIEYFKSNMLATFGKRVVAFLDVRKVLHYFLCLGDKTLAFLGSSSYGVCDDVNGLVNYYKDKEQKEEQNAISFVDELDLYKFKENCCFKWWLCCDGCSIINRLECLDGCISRKNSLNEKFKINVESEKKGTGFYSICNDIPIFAGT